MILRILSFVCVLVVSSVVSSPFRFPSNILTSRLMQDTQYSRVNHIFLICFDLVHLILDCSLKDDLAYSGHWPTPYPHEQGYHHCPHLPSGDPYQRSMGGVKLGTKPPLSLLLLCVSLLLALTACGFYPRPCACDFL